MPRAIGALSYKEHGQLVTVSGSEFYKINFSHNNMVRYQWAVIDFNIWMFHAVNF